MAIIMTDEGGLLFLNCLVDTATSFDLLLCTDTTLSDSFTEVGGEMSLIAVDADSNSVTLSDPPTISVIAGIPTITWADETFDFTEVSPGTPAIISSIAITALVGATTYLLCVDHITPFTPDVGASLVIKPVFQLGAGTPLASMT